MYIPKCSVCNVYLIIILKASARPCNTIIKSATALKLERVIKTSHREDNLSVPTHIFNCHLSTTYFNHRLQL